jgi:cyclic pyranopterin phosphate synthase
LRRAVAEAFVRISSTTLRRLRKGDLPKGDLPATVRLAGILAAKRTPELIPLCHTVGLDAVAVDLAWESVGVRITATAQATDRTGVEMEAMVAASVAALTFYDMVKSLERDVTIEHVRLLEKSGGRSGRWRREG